VLKRLCSVLVLAALAASAPVQAEFPESQGIGVIEDIDLDASTLIVNGLRFQVAIDANVSINGTYGAFTLLHQGMLVRYSYRIISPTERVIFDIETRPPNEPYESS